MINYKIRSAVEEDLPVIVAIYNSTIASRSVTADLEPVTVESRKTWFFNHTEKRPIWVVMNDHDDMLGWISFEPFYGRAAYQYTAEVSIYLHENTRGQGLGRQLLQEALDACPNLGIKTILSYIFGHNQASLRLFERFGFERWANFPNVAELDGVERDLVILGKRVSD
ncbi:GNAT family N-acetyltransferase [Metabacillus arenae]|uniref:N-acetyltransferase family protein n=1 Tax=Metabacillus arenae TaxID=2771434 RepID=A0A926RZV4_9BACI|nr:GNAT family N-acetyltransferase [Metabacillus arenae]MBD1383225.1 N-acetyltransferase family protein [Metabacillus arenae]